MPTWFVVGLIAVFLYMVRSILTPFIFAIILAYVLTPVADGIAWRTRIKRELVAIGLFVVIVGGLGLLGYLTIPQLVREAQELSARAPELIEGGLVSLTGSPTPTLMGRQFSAATVTESLSSVLSSGEGPNSAMHLGVIAIEDVFKLFLTFILFLYLLLTGDRLIASALRQLPPQRAAVAARIVADVDRVLERYVLGLAFLVLLMSTITYLVLALVFHLPHALLIGVLTGFLEIIPLVGPVVAGTIAATLGLASGGVPEAIGIIIAFTILRQLEDHLVMPLVIGRAVHLHPVVTIFAVLSGSAIFGITGMLLAIPVAVMIKVILSHVLASTREGAEHS